MAGATVIDQLIVKLGLDPKEFNKGQKQAAAEIVKTEQAVQKSSKSMSASFVATTAKLFGVVSALQAVRKVGGYISDLSVSVRQLGIDSKNLGTSAAVLRNWQNVAEMFGGKAEDATKSIAGLTKAVYDLAYNGQISDSLVMLGRLGVAFQDAQGNARDFTAVALDTEAALARGQKEGRLTRENAYQIALQAGFDPGLANALADGKATEELNRQQQRRQVQGPDVAKATEWERSVANRDQAVTAAATGSSVFNKQADAGIAANNAIANNAQRTADILSGDTKALSGAFKDATNATSSFASKVWNATGDGVKNWLRNQTRGMRNNNPGNLKYAGQASAIGQDREGFAQFPDMATGIKEANRQLDLYALRGIDTISEIVETYAPKSENDAESYKKSLESYVGVSRDQPLTSGDRATLLAGIFRHEGQGSIDSGMVADVLQGAYDTSPAGDAGAGGSGFTEVNISRVDINTQATDAEGIARDFAGATQRKFMAAQADAGVN